MPVEDQVKLSADFCPPTHPIKVRGGAQEGRNQKLTTKLEHCRVYTQALWLVVHSTCGTWRESNQIFAAPRRISHPSGHQDELVLTVREALVVKR